ncbi:MAG: sulfatase-like hydrolase/transferase, partial [Pseudomonadota bacterium]
MDAQKVILILADNQQAATLGVYGNHEARTPHLDALAGDGMTFTHAFCANAYCSPCRASVLTGLMPSGHGVHSWIDDRTPEDWPQDWHALRGLDTLPERLRAAGYATGIFGKYHLGVTDTVGPGWDQWCVMADGHVRSFNDNAITENGYRLDRSGHAVEIFTDRALAWLSGDGPRFAYVPFPAPYGHWPATRDTRNLPTLVDFSDCPLKTVPRLGLSPEAVAHYDRIKDQSGGGLDFSMLLSAPNDLATLRNYYAQISLIDRAVGRMRAAHPDAVIIYCADHGLSLGHHGFWGHGGATYPSNLHRAAHSVPLIAAGPGVVRGQSDDMVGTTDLYATLLDICGAGGAGERPSRSLWPRLTGTAPPLGAFDTVISEQEETRVLRTKDWVFFRRFRAPGSPDLPDALYDLRSDPDETVNLAADPAQAERVADFCGQIDDFFARHARAEFDLWRGGCAVQN